LRSPNHGSKVVVIDGTASNQPSNDYTSKMDEFKLYPIVESDKAPFSKIAKPSEKSSVSSTVHSIIQINNHDKEKSSKNNIK